MGSSRTAPPSECSKPRILVVDDNVDLALSLALVLDAWGYDVRTAGDGLTALNLSRGFHPNIVIADICMPGMNGFELARNLRKSHGVRIRLMAVTANDSLEIRTQADQAGFDEFNVKPVDLTTLREKLDLPH